MLTERETYSAGVPAFNPDIDELEVMASALGLVLQFVEKLVRDPLDVEVRDERELPASKQTMIDCFSLILMSETRPQWRSAFYQSGLKLAYFWPDVGPERLKLPPGVFDRTLAIDETVESRYLHLMENERQIRSFSNAFSRVGPEHARISRIFDHAVERITTLLAL